MKPYSDACEENKQPILEVITPYFSNVDQVLEIGSGTGQHAVFFAEHLPHLSWHCSDMPIYHSGIKLWLAEYTGDNLLGPHTLDVCQETWPVAKVPAVFSANTTHIMSWAQVECLFAGVGRTLTKAGYFCLYGPFNYHGEYSSDSNRRFDLFLRQRDAQSGLRDVDDLHKLAHTVGLEFIHDHEMPVNNRILVWQKT